MEGRIKAANSHGYGFIETEKNIDFFFHHSQFHGDWKILLRKFVNGEQLIVSFDNDPDAPSGPRALNVCIIDKLGD